MSSNCLFFLLSHGFLISCRDFLYLDIEILVNFRVQSWLCLVFLEVVASFYEHIAHGGLARHECRFLSINREIHRDSSVHGDFRVVIDFLERVFILGVHLDTGAREDDVGRRVRRVGFNHSAIDVDRDGMDVVLRETSTQRHLYLHYPVCGAVDHSV